MDELVKQILAFGLVPTILLVFLFLLIQDPSRAEKLKALIIKPFYRFKKWFSRSYISSEVNSSVNHFLKNSILSYLIHDPKSSIKVSWVRKSKDPIFHKNGNLIIRLKQDDDQTRNILNATQVALPQLVCPLVRGNVSHSYNKAIDLALMQKLSEKIGRHGKSIFKKYFLDPETKEDQTIASLISKLIELDNHGFFVPIMLNELEIVGEGLFADSDSTDYTNEAIQFIEYLLTMVRREIGSEVELNYFNKPFSVGTMLLAKAHRADTQGLRPYLKRLRIKIEKGCDSIYVIAFPNAFSFFDRLIKAIDGHESLNIEKIINTIDYATDPSKKKTHFRIALLSNNKLFGDQVFRDRLTSNKIEEGIKIKGTVDDISEKEALVNIKGLRAYIDRRDCSWEYSKSCTAYLEVGKEYDFIVKSIQEDTGTIYLTRKTEENNPWKSNELPKVDDVIKVKVYDNYNKNLIAIYGENLTALIPHFQISWHQQGIDQILTLIGDELEVKVTSINPENEELKVSIRDMHPDPWPEIHKAYPKGKEFNGKITEVTDNFVRVDIGDSVNGIVPKEALMQAGFEYANFQDNLVKGQGLEVVISKVFLSKQKIRLDLKRNVKPPNK